MVGWEGERDWNVHRGRVAAAENARGGKAVQAVAVAR